MVLVISYYTLILLAIGSKVLGIVALGWWLVLLPWYGAGLLLPAFFIIHWMLSYGFAMLFNKCRTACRS